MPPRRRSGLWSPRREPSAAVQEHALSWPRAQCRQIGLASPISLWHGGPSSPLTRKDLIPMSRLRNGQPFPPLEVPALVGGMISLPDDLAGSYGVVLIYRGSWCPYCNATRAAF